MITIPDNIMQQLTMFCEANEIGLIEIRNNLTGISIIMIGPTTITSDQASIFGASMLLDAVITGRANKFNAEKKSEEEENKPSVN